MHNTLGLQVLTVFLVLHVNCHTTDNIKITVHWDNIGLPAALPSRPVTSRPFQAFKHRTLDAKFTNKMTGKVILEHRPELQQDTLSPIISFLVLHG